MSKAGKITVTVEASRNQQTLTISTVGSVGGLPVNTINNKVTYSSRSSAATAVGYWTAILEQAILQLSS